MGHSPHSAINIRRSRTRDAKAKIPISTDVHTRCRVSSPRSPSNWDPGRVRPPLGAALDHQRSTPPVSRGRVGGDRDDF
jgi:hypothetical protein